MPSKFPPAFRAFLKEQANISQGTCSAGVPAGFLSYAEWFKIWAKACEQFPDCTEADGDEEDDNKYAKKVRLR